MKKFLFLLPLVVVGAARAELTKCVYLNPEMTCTAGRALNTYNGKASWDATCTDSVGSTDITGVFRCGSQSGTAQGATTDILDTDYSETTNKNCWCKIATPAVSMWVFHSTVSSQGNCYGNCGRLCLDALQATGATAFKTAIFNNLGA